MNRPDGLEQGFTVERPPAGGEAGDPLVVRLEIAGPWRAEPAAGGRAVVLRGAGATVGWA